MSKTSHSKVQASWWFWLPLTLVSVSELRAQDFVPAQPKLTWQELGPAPISSGSFSGRISALACSPTDPNRYFAAGADGGVWRTTDGGQSWTYLTGDMPTTSMGALALAPSDENRIYAGTGEANYANHSRYGLGLLRSDDGGDHWQLLAENVFAGRCFSKIVVHPSNPDRLYAAVARAGGFPELAAAKNHPQATDPLGVYLSQDGGQTWQLLGGLPNLSVTDLAMDPTNPDVLYAGVGRIFGDNQNGVYKSIDGGASWNRLGGGLPTTSVGRVNFALAPSQPNRLYVVFVNPATSTGGSASTKGVWRSNNGGSSFSSLSVGNFQASYGWYLSVVSVRPTDSDTAFLGGFSLERTTNAGSSWSNVTPPHVDMHAIAWDASGRLVVGDDGGVHRSSDLGSSWTSLNQGLGTIQFYAGLSSHPTDLGILYGGTQDNGTNRLQANGSWSQVFGGDGGWTQVDPQDGDRVFVEYQGTGNLYRSTNGGTFFNWSASGISGSDRNCFLPPYLIDPNNSQRMLYGTQRVYRSTNGGNSWSAISGDLSRGAGAIRALAIAPTNSNRVYAATNDGNVQVSSNGGSSFSLVLSSIPGWPRVTRELTVDPTDDQTVYLAVSAFGTDQVRRSQDAGQSWQVLDGDLPDVPVNVIAVDPGQPPILFAGTDQGLYWSQDDGQNWKPYGVGLPLAPVIDILLEKNRQRILVSTQGRGAWVAEYR